MRERDKSIFFFYPAMGNIYGQGTRDILAIATLGEGATTWITEKDLLKNFWRGKIRNSVPGVLYDKFH